MRFLILLFFIIFLNAEKIDEYNVKVFVLDNGDLQIIENILYDFGKNKRHGIFRNIPLNHNKIELLSIYQDGKAAEYNILYKRGEVIYKIGNKNVLLTNKHQYQINYVIKKTVFEKDDIHNVISLNAIGTGWKVPIYNIQIDVLLPQELIKNKFIVYFGKNGSTDILKYNKITPTHYQILKSHLNPNEGITFDIIFDKNLIEAVETIDNKWAYLFLIIYSLGLYLYYKQHKIPNFSISPQYYPPKDLNILQASIIIDQELNDEDISVAILDMAVRGYLQIKKVGEHIVLEKLKSSDSLSKEEKILFDALFDEDDIVTLAYNNTISFVKFYNRLQLAISNIKSSLYKWGVEEGYFKENLFIGRTKFVLTAFIPLAIMIIVSIVQLSNFYDNYIAVVAFWFFLILMSLITFDSSSSLAAKIVFSFQIVIILWVLNYLEIPFLNPVSITFFNLIPLWFVYRHLNLYTKKGIEKLKYLLGFKEFLLRVEKDKLVQLLKENPNYLDETLPYAVLFGVDHWFDFYKEFNVNSNIKDLNKTIYHDMVHSMNYISNYSSKSTSSGSGGSSGGGSGGGGGGSW